MSDQVEYLLSLIDNWHKIFSGLAAAPVVFAKLPSQSKIGKNKKVEERYSDYSLAYVWSAYKLPIDEFFLTKMNVITYL